MDCQNVCGSANVYIGEQWGRSCHPTVVEPLAQHAEATMWELLTPAHGAAKSV